MNGSITWRNINPKFQLVHPGKLAENQLAWSHNLLIMDERTSVKIFTAGALQNKTCLQKESAPQASR